MNDKRLSIDDFELLKLIGKGSYGRVLLVRKKDTSELLALKILKKSFLVEKNQIRNTRSQRSILQRVQHPFIIRLSYAFQSSSKLFLALEYCPAGQLFFHLNYSGRFDQNRAKFYAAGVFLALSHLHSQDVIYRDLKPENVLIDQKGFPKITDFGLSRENIIDNSTVRSICGTPEYLAPEILMRQGYGKPVDWWSFGCLIYEMLVGLPPFYVQKRQEIYKKILTEEVYYPDFISWEAKDLMMALLVKNPVMRIDGAGIVGHPWFESIDWNKMERKEIQPPYVPMLRDNTDTRYFSDEFTAGSVEQRNNRCVSVASSPTFSNFSFDAQSEFTMNFNQ